MDENRERVQERVESVQESRMEHSMVKNTNPHSTLPTHQFYTRNTFATSTLCNTISHVPTPNATPRQFKMSSLKLDKLDNELSLINTGLRSLEDKKVVKLLLRHIKTGILLARKQRNVSNFAIPELLEGISNMVMELYYTGNVPRSYISLQSRMSDRPMSTTEGCRNIQMSSVPMNRMFPSSQAFNQPTVNLHRFETSAQAVPVPVSSRRVSQLSEKLVARGRGSPRKNAKPSIASDNAIHRVPEEFDEGDCLFNESMIAQHGDETASKQVTFSDNSFAVPQPPRLKRRKPTPRRGLNNSGISKAKVETAVSENSPALAQSNNNSTMTLPEGARGVTRAGRQIKTPAQYWKGFESMWVDTSICANKTKGQGNKENQTMASKKRKCLETGNMVAKKKKVEEEPVESSDIDSDELFGTFTYKKPTRTALQALSPNTGMTSSKKAAGGPLGKETPSCKALGMMINMSGHSAASSVTMEAPLAKGAQFVKRVTKNLEKNQKKARTKR